MPDLTSDMAKLSTSPGLGSGPNGAMLVPGLCDNFSKEPGRCGNKGGSYCNHCYLVQVCATFKHLLTVSSYQADRNDGSIAANNAK
jgi:hypothetical protein